MRVVVFGISSDEGTVIVFDAFTLEGEPIQFACDRRPAVEILSRLRWEDEDVEIQAVIEPWMLVD